jgi:hypothetical protein
MSMPDREGLEEAHAQYRKAWRLYALAVPGSEVVERPEVFIAAGHGRHQCRLL